MKRSNIFMALALTIPLAATGASIVAGVSKVAAEKSKHHVSDAKGGSFGTTYEETVPVGPALTILVEAARLDVTFDPELKNEARVKIEADGKDAVQYRIVSDSFSFRPHGRDVDDVEISLVLPVRFEALTLELHAGKCSLNATAPLSVDTLRVATNAASCEIRAAQLLSQKVAVEVNAGKLGLAIGALKAVDIESKTSAGKVEWRIDSLAFGEGDHRGWSIRNEAGKTDVQVKQAPELAINMKSSLGSVEVRRGDQSERISGLNDERTIAAGAGAPILTLDAQMGSIEVDLGQ